MSLPTNPWRPSFGPLPAALAGRIPVEPAFADRIRAAANRFYIDEMAAIREEPDEGLARERQARLDETMDAAVEARRTGVLSPTAVRLMSAMEQISDDGTQLRSRASVAGSLPVASRSGRVIPGRCAGSNPADGNIVEQSGSSPHGHSPRRPHERAPVHATKGGRHEDLAAPARDLPLNPVGKLLQLRPGQDVAVFSDAVTWDGRRA